MGEIPNVPSAVPVSLLSFCSSEGMSASAQDWSHSVEIKRPGSSAIQCCVLECVLDFNTS